LILDLALTLFLVAAVIYLLVAMSRAKLRIASLEARVARLSLADAKKTDASKAKAVEPAADVETPERSHDVEVPKPTSMEEIFHRGRLIHTDNHGFQFAGRHFRSLRDAQMHIDTMDGVEPELSKYPKPIMAETAQPSDAVASGRWEKVASTATPKQETSSKREPEPAGGTVIAQSSTPHTVVFSADRVAAVSVWLWENWFLAVAALSLALAGIFLVQYGVENGLLTPVWRVAGAAALGLALVVAGEVARRRFGDGEAGSTTNAAFFPSTFSGAGLVVLFAAALAAHHLYGLIGPGASFAWLVVIAALGVTLGWFYGPYLTVVALSGSILAPFLVGGSSNNPELFYYYFGLVAVVALLIDAKRRWAWVSVLGLGGAFLASTFIFAQGAGDVHYLVFAFLMVVAAVIIPPLKLTPQHGGTTALEALLYPQNRESWPEFPTRIAFGTISAATLAAFSVAITDTGALEVWQALACIVSIFAIVVFWSRSGEALSDGALFALPALVAIIGAQQVENGSLYREFIWGLARKPETGPPLDASALVIMGALISSIALWRGLFSGRFARVWSGGAALAAASVVLLLEGVWQPARLLGDYVWAFHAMAVAALMVFGAITVARLDGEDRERASYFALSAAIMITFFVVVLFSQTALTLAIAALVFGAAYVDRMLNLRLLTFFVAGGVVAIGWRLVVDPGAIDARDMPYWEVFLNYGGSIAGLVGAWAALAPRRRWQTQIMAASAAWAAIAVFFTVILAKIFEDTYGIEGSKHWNLGLIALVWLISSAVQLWRLKNGGVWMTRIRLGLAGIFGVIGLGAFSVTWILLLNMASGLDGTEIVRGPYIFDTLLVTVGLPAFLFAVISIRFTHLPRGAQQAAGWISVALASLYVGLEIRRFWQGDYLHGAVVLDVEFYSYTSAMLVGATGMLFAAFLRRPGALHIVAVAGVALILAILINFGRLNETGLVRGPYIFDTLMLTFGLPAFLFAAIVIRFTHLPRVARQAVGWGSGALVCLYVGLEIRRFWHGAYIYGGDVFSGELYSYTTAVLLGATGMLLAAFFRRPGALHIVTVAGVALIIITLINLVRLGDTGLAHGPYVFDSLMLTFGLPAILFAVISIFFTHLPRATRLAVEWGSGALVSLYVGLEIRRFWQGDFLLGEEMFDGELYSYTIAMLIGATGLLFAAFFRRSNGLRQVAVAGIALTIAKVFLIDMSGLTGLIRVASFLGLGLSMAGLALIVRLMNARWELPDAKSTAVAQND
jgi:uncharacterized membrane protein